MQRGLVRTTGGKTTPKTKKNQQSGKGKKPTKRVVLRKQTLGGSIAIKKKKITIHTYMSQITTKYMHMRPQRVCVTGTKDAVALRTYVRTYVYAEGHEWVYVRTYGARKCHMDMSRLHIWFLLWRVI